MKAFTLFSLFVFLLFVVQFAQAQTVDEIIGKYENARGGKEKLNALKTIYMEGVTQMMGNEITIKITKEQNKLSRRDFEVASGTGYFIVTETEGWTFFPGRSTEATKLPEEFVTASQPELDIAGAIVDYAAKGHKAELVGKETLNAVDCYKIKLTPAKGNEILYWIDASTYLLLQSSTKTKGRNGEVEQFTIYSDYKDVEGVKIPHTVETKGGLSGSSTFDKVELNKPVDPKLYKP